MESEPSANGQAIASPKARPSTPRKPDHLRSPIEPPLPPPNMGFLPTEMLPLVDSDGVVSSEPAGTSQVPKIAAPQPKPVQLNGVLSYEDVAQAVAGAEMLSKDMDNASHEHSAEQKSQLGVPRSPSSRGPSSPTGWRVYKSARSAVRRSRSDRSPRPERLCPACQKLDLTIDKFVIDHRADAGQVWPDFWGKRRMGSLAEIKARNNCELCLLLIKAMDHDEGDSQIPSHSSAKQPDCYLYWTVDGRDRVQEDQGNRVRTVKRTRRLCIEWSHNPQDKSYIVLVAPEGKFTADGRINNDKWEHSTLFLGRLLTSLDEPNIELIRRWLGLCITHHKTECQVHGDLKQRFITELRRRSPFFTVIDVHDMCLTELPDDEDSDARYVALSYTWGEETRTSGGHGPSESKSRELFRTTTKNSSQLGEKDGIAVALEENMPEAIQNAIYLTEQLGYRYLWVDSLCIIQDDPTSWELNAEVMDVVYGNAEFTICAADGERQRWAEAFPACDSAQVGLKALFHSEESEYKRHAEEFAIDYQAPERMPLKLLLSRPSESYIWRSRWNKRAWTFQERLLSRRCLIFVAGRVYFQCRSTTMSEDIYSEASTAGWSVELHGAPAHTLKRLPTDPVSVYKKCLEMYTARKLSRDGDILAAFAGIANVLHPALGTNCDTIFGLPISHFDWALLWEPEELPARRLPKDKVRDRLFPTWSWCGWMGKKITYKTATVGGPEINLHEWLLKHTWITYYIRDGQGRLRLVWDPLRHESSDHIEERWRGYNSPETGLPAGSEVSGYSEYDYHGRPFNRQLPTRGRVQKTGRQFVLKMNKFPRKVPVLRPGPEEYRNMTIAHKPRLDEPYLQFWTWMASFYLGEETEEDRFSSGGAVGAGLKRFAILDAHGDFAGTCVLSHSWSSAAQSKERQKFIALSEARDFDISEYGCWNLYSEDERETVPWQLYNVMMLEYGGEDKNVAYRAGLGKVYKSAFEAGTGEAGSAWEEIILG